MEETFGTRERVKYTYAYCAMSSLMSDSGGKSVNFPSYFVTLAMRRNPTVFVSL